MIMNAGSHVLNTMHARSAVQTLASERSDATRSQSLSPAEKSASAARTSVQETDASSRPAAGELTMDSLAEALNRSFGDMQSLQFTVDKDTGVSVIKVTQSVTGEVVRQIPNEEALSMIERLDGRQLEDNDTAVLFDQMA